MSGVGRIAKASAFAAVVALAFGAAPCVEPGIQVFNSPASLCSGTPSGTVGPVTNPECCAGKSDLTQPQSNNGNGTSNNGIFTGWEGYDFGSGDGECRGIEVREPFCPVGQVCDVSQAEITLSLTMGSIQESETCCRKCLCFGDPECQSFSGQRAEWITCDGRAPDCDVSQDVCESVVDHKDNACKWVGDDPNWQSVAKSGSKCQTDFELSGHPTMNMYNVPGFDLTLTLGERGIIQSATFTTSDGVFTLDADDCFKYDPRKGGDEAHKAWTPSQIPSLWKASTVGRAVEIGWHIMDPVSGMLVAATCTRAYANGKPGLARLNIDSVVETDLSREGDGFCSTGVIGDRLQSAEDAARVAELHARCTPQNLPNVQIACQELTSLSCNLWTLPSKIEYWCLNADLENTNLKSKADPVQACINQLNAGTDKDRARKWAILVCEANQLPLRQCLSDITQFGWYSFVSTHSDGLINAGNAIQTCESQPSSYGKSESGCDQGARVEYQAQNGEWIEEFFVPYNKPPCGEQLLIRGDENPNLFLHPVRVRQCGFSAVCTANNGCAPQPSFETSLFFDSVDCPTTSPTPSPSKSPTETPTSSPTVSPTGSPTVSPSESPSKRPTESPTGKPTDSPTSAPSVSPTESPTDKPSVSPTMSPTGKPSVSPSKSPTKSPTERPTGKPTASPTEAPSVSPTESPTETPTVSPTESPTGKPTVSPTESPTGKPTVSPTEAPSVSPTTSPTKNPTESPSKSPTESPTLAPSTSPTESPTKKPTESPSKSPTKSPTERPTGKPTKSPTFAPTTAPVCATTVFRGHLQAENSPKFGADFTAFFTLQLNKIGACTGAPRNVYQVGCQSDKDMYLGVFVEDCSSKVYASVLGNNGEVLEVCKNQMPELDLYRDYGFDVTVAGNQVTIKIDNVQVCQDQFVTDSAGAGSGGGHTCVYRSSPDYLAAFSCEQGITFVSTNAPECYECSVDTSISSPQVCRSDGSSTKDFMTCESCCLSESILDINPDGPSCRWAQTLEPFCDAQCSATCAPTCDPNQGSAGEQARCQEEIDACTAEIQACFIEQQACAALAKPENNAVLQLGVTIDQAALDESCCASCACWGDPLCSSFDGTTDAWVLCDSRNVEDCMVSEDLCKTQSDHLGNTCTWDQDIANNLVRRDDIQYFGSPCQPDWSQGDATMIMYKLEDVFQAELSMGERGVIEELRIKTDRGSATLVADKCYDALQQKDVAAAFTVSGAASLDQILTAGYVQGPGQDELTVTIIDSISKIFIETVCVRHQSSRATAYRLNVKHLIETDEVRLNNVEGEGFCVENSINKGQSTNDIATLVHDICMEGLGDTVLLCKGISDPSCTKGSLSRGVREWCATANVYDGSADSAARCYRQIRPQREEGVYGRWVRLYCDAVSYQRAAGVKKSEFASFCVSRVNNEGIKSAVEQWGTGAKPTGIDAQTCASSISEYKVDLDPCSFGIAVEYFDQALQDWKQSFFIPVSKTPCGNVLDIPYGTHPELFTNQIRFRQCEVDNAKCPLVAACQKAVGFDVDYKFQYVKTEVCKDIAVDSLPIFIPQREEKSGDKGNDSNDSSSSRASTMLAATCAFASMRRFL